MILTDLMREMLEAIAQVGDKSMERDRKVAPPVGKGEKIIGTLDENLMRFWTAINNIHRSSISIANLHIKEHGKRKKCRNKGCAALKNRSTHLAFLGYTMRVMFHRELISTYNRHDIREQLEVRAGGVLTSSPYPLDHIVDTMHTASHPAVLN